MPRAFGLLEVSVIQWPKEPAACLNVCKIAQHAGLGTHDLYSMFPDYCCCVIRAMRQSRIAGQCTRRLHQLPLQTTTGKYLSPCVALKLDKLDHQTLTEHRIAHLGLPTSLTSTPTYQHMPPCVQSARSRLQVHLALTADPTEMRIMWKTKGSRSAVLLCSTIYTLYIYSCAHVCTTLAVKLH